MNEISLSKHVAAPPQRVWELLTDIEHAPEVMSGIDSVERLDGGTGFGVGTKWRETRTLFGRQATEEMEVTAVDEGHSYVTEADGKGAHYRSTLSVAPEGEGTLLEMRFGGEPTGPVSRVLGATVGKLFEGATKKAIQRDLDDLAAAAESP